MKSTLVLAVILAIHANGEPSPDIIPVSGGISGDGITSRYWDCCKPSCAWKENIDTKKKIPVRTCELDGRTTIDAEIESACVSDKVPASYTCSDQQAFVINSTLSYGFAAASFTGGVDFNRCCSCILLEFQGQLLGKKFLVQVVNTGSPLQKNQFDLVIPGGGVGIYNEGCIRQFNTTNDGWGDRYGGVHSQSDCKQLPEDLQPGCNWRFEFMEGVPNPDVKFYEVECPKEITDISKCVV